MTNGYRFEKIEGGKTAKDHIEEMSNEIKEVVYKHADRVSLALAIGVIEIVKFEIWEAREGSADDH